MVSYRQRTPHEPARDAPPRHGRAVRPATRDRATRDWWHAHFLARWSSPWRLRSGGPFRGELPGGPQEGLDTESIVLRLDRGDLPHESGEFLWRIVLAHAPEASANVGERLRRRLSRLLRQHGVWWMKSRCHRARISRTLRSRAPLH